MLHREASAFTEDGQDRDDEVIEYRHNASETLLEVLARLRGRSSKDLGARARSLPAAEPKPAAAPAPMAVPPPRPPTPPPPPREESARLSRRVPQDFGAMFDVWVPDEAPLPAVRAEATRVPSGAGVAAPSLLARRRAALLLDDAPDPLGPQPSAIIAARSAETAVDGFLMRLSTHGGGPSNATQTAPRRATQLPSIGRCTRSFDSGPTRRLSRTRWGTPTRVQCKPQCIRPLAEPM
jgi:hypothetical protein